MSNDTHSLTPRASRLVQPSMVAIGMLFSIVLFMTAAVHYVHSERYFYYWDNFAYNRATLESLAALQDPNISWLAHLQTSVQTGFSQLFTVPIAPLMVLLGESRAVFVGGITGLFLLPCAAMCTFLVNRIQPLVRWEWLAVFTACASLPVFWRTVFAGYPDIGGICLVAAAALVISHDLGYRRWKTAFAMGLLLPLIFLFRRHLVYCMIPLMGTATLFAVVTSLRQGTANHTKVLAGAILRLGTSTLFTVLVIYLIAPNYFRELIGTNFRELYLPFQYSTSTAFKQHLEYVGIGFALLGFGGLTWGALRAGANRVFCVFLLCYAAFSICIWIFYLRYLGVQYNLHFAFVIAIGIGVSLVLVNRQFGRTWPAALLALALLGVWFDRFAFWTPLPKTIGAILPLRMPPLVNPDYDKLRGLIDGLRSRVKPERNNIMVASSSTYLNADMLLVGESSLYGRTNRSLEVMYGSHADTAQPYPLRDMLAADWVILATPFQHHLRVEDQGVVLAPLEIMSVPSPWSSDFENAGMDFTMSNKIAVSVFERKRPSSFATSVDTARRVFNTVGMVNALTGPFMTGLAVTGAEYYDARLLVPITQGTYRLDLSHVLCGGDQSEVVLFVRITDASIRQVTGAVGGPARTELRLQSEYFPDESETRVDPRWTQLLTLSHGEPFMLTAPDLGPGILAIRLQPVPLPESGRAFDVILDQLKLVSTTP